LMIHDEEMLRVAKDPAAVRALAKRLLALDYAGWDEWQTQFLQDMAKFTGPRPLTDPQVEKLFELRESEWVSQYRGLSIRILIEKCVMARDDLDEDSAEFLERLKGKAVVMRRRLRWLLWCCYQLGEIEPHMR
jgi:hypothetical protein